VQVGVAAVGSGWALDAATAQIREQTRTLAEEMAETKSPVSKP